MAKTMKSVASMVMLILVAHCWLCVFTYYDDNNGTISKYLTDQEAGEWRLMSLLTAKSASNLATVRITPSDDKGRMLLGKRPMMMKTSELSTSNLERESAANMLRAPTEDATKSRW